MGDYPDRYEDKYGDGRYRNTVAENKPKVEEVFGPEKVSSFLRQALEAGDTNGDGTLSLREFEKYQKTVTLPLSKQTAQFVSKHFGSLSLLSSDGVFSEGGISGGDISTIRYTDALIHSRDSYAATYRDVGGKVGAVTGFFGGVGAQAADFILTGGGVTFVSTIVHMGAGATLPFVSEHRIPPLAIASGIVAGMMWGPLYGSLGGYAGGRLAGEKLASYYFQRTHEPQIKAMLQELNLPHSSSAGQVDWHAVTPAGAVAGNEPGSESDREFENKPGKLGTNANTRELEEKLQMKSPARDSSGILFNDAYDLFPRKY